MTGCPVLLDDIVGVTAPYTVHPIIAGFLLCLMTLFAASAALFLMLTGNRKHFPCVPPSEWFCVFGRMLFYVIA